ncbi:unnamed protein product [Calicophoron daubneyi]|uniref:Uncharacterized protein n=1 Tax=Calicophoron daubneyi TaxID=300641 RepID=A0AAV2TRB6_CALDB
MAYTAEKIPVVCLEAARRPMQHGSRSSLRSHETRGSVAPYDESDSDIDSPSVTRSMLIHKAKAENETSPKTNGTSPADESLMHWLIQEFAQKDLKNNKLATNGEVSERSSFVSTNQTIQLHHDSDRIQDRLSSRFSQEGSSTKNRHHSPELANSTNLYYPYLGRSRDQCRGSIGKPQTRLSAQETAGSIDRLLSEIQRKMTDLQMADSKIQGKLLKAHVIIGDLKSNMVKQKRAEMEAERQKGGTVLRIKRLYSAKQNSSQTSLTNSAYADSRSQDRELSVSNLFHQQHPSPPTKIRSESSYLLPEKTPPYTNGYTSHPSSPPSQTTNDGSSASRREYSVHRKFTPVSKSSGLKNRETSNLTYNSKRVSSAEPPDLQSRSGESQSSKPSWFERALSQVTLNDWTGRDKRYRYVAPPSIDKSVPNISPSLIQTTQTNRGLSSLIRRPFTRKSVSPGPEPDFLRPLSPYTKVSDRSASLMQLSSILGTTDSSNHAKNGRIQFVPLPYRSITELNEEAPPMRNHTNGDGRSNSDRARYTSVNKPVLRHELDADSGIYSYDSVKKP